MSPAMTPHPKVRVKGSLKRDVQHPQDVQPLQDDVQLFQDDVQLLQDVQPPLQDVKYPLNMTSELHLGEWERSLAWRDEDFARDWQRQPHTKRRTTILRTHPLVRKLYGTDPMTVCIILVSVANNLLMSYFFGKTSGWIGMIGLIVTASIVGASIAGLMAICIHECVHRLVVPGLLGNKLLALLCNVGTPVPIAMSFRRYHSEHHVYQGSETKDPDMPLPWELRLIRGNFWSKFIWLAIYPLLYAIRAIVRGKTVSFWESINTIFTITCNIATLYFFGIRGWLFTLVSFLVGYTFHPVAAHFLQEHYTFASKQETYNYYGWANLLFLNIGFHNEHHDFPGIPGRRLPFVTKIAPCYYQPLFSHKSWRMVIWNFLTDSNIGPQSRCARN